jgi:uncharacterized protein HemX
MIQLADLGRTTQNTQRITVKLLALLFTLVPILLNAQEEIPMADTMRSEGKIYVLVAIVLVILIGLVGYLFMLDKKVSRVEKDLASK